MLVHVAKVANERRLLPAGWAETATSAYRPIGKEFGANYNQRVMHRLKVEYVRDYILPAVASPDP